MSRDQKRGVRLEDVIVVLDIPKIDKQDLYSHLTKLPLYAAGYTKAKRKKKSRFMIEIQQSVLCNRNDPKYLQVLKEEHFERKEKKRTTDGKYYVP